MKAAMFDSGAADTASLTARERILHTAHDLFYREGIRATGVDRLIAESAVTKTTFYRHFPSKNELILCFLEFRHTRWMAWFEYGLAQHGGTVDAICPTLREWFRSTDFRGCAFINTLGELGGEMPKVVEAARAHKQDMAKALEQLLPASRQRKMVAQSLAQAIDGAIVRAQIDGNPKLALKLLAHTINH